MKTLKLITVSLAVVFGLTACSTAPTTEPTATSTHDVSVPQWQTDAKKKLSTGSVPPLSISEGWVGSTDSKAIGSVPCSPAEICEVTALELPENVRKSGNSEAKTTTEKVTEKALSEPTHGVTTGQTVLTTSENRPPIKAKNNAGITEPVAGELTPEELEKPVFVEPLVEPLVELPPCAKTSMELAPYGQFSYLNCDDGTSKFHGFTTQNSDETPGTVVCVPVMVEKADGCLTAMGSGWRFTPAKQAMTAVLGGGSNV